DVVRVQIAQRRRSGQLHQIMRKELQISVRSVDRLSASLRVEDLQIGNVHSRAGAVGNQEMECIAGQDVEAEVNVADAALFQGGKESSRIGVGSDGIQGDVPRRRRGSRLTDEPQAGIVSCGHIKPIIGLQATNNAAAVYIAPRPTTRGKLQDIPSRTEVETIDDGDVR